MPVINVTVRNKVAFDATDLYVCGNTDYIVHFVLDEEWAAYDLKTARFSMPGGAYIDQVFQGSECPVPRMTNITYFVVGLFAGDLHTTTPSTVKAARSILCSGGIPEDPPEDVYGQIMEAVNDARSDAKLALEMAAGGATGTGVLKLGHALQYDGEGRLSVLVAEKPEDDNTLPITSAAVQTTVGNIEILLGTI